MQDSSREAQLKTAYSLLYSSFGPQGWWPVHSEGRGYHPGDFSVPSTERGRLEIAFGAILTQQASWKNAEKALMNLIERDMLDPHRILETPEEELQSLIRSSGYFRQKAERLRVFSGFLVDEYGGSISALLSGDRETIRDELLSLKGIGKETADSIMLYAGRIPSFVVDAYTFRMAERMGIQEERDYDALKEMFERALEPDFRIYNEYHALIVELGKRNCRKRMPDCHTCPLRALCAYHKNL